jgi:hypothetical protein
MIRELASEKFASSVPVLARKLGLEEVPPGSAAPPGAEKLTPEMEIAAFRESLNKRRQY